MDFVGEDIMKIKPIKSLIIAIILFLLVANIYSQEVISQKSSIKRVEITDTEVREIISSKTNRQYFAYVHLPSGYHESDKNYPVLYLTDAEAFFYGMYTTIFRFLRIHDEIRDLILVGIANGGNPKQHGSTRRRDYTPTKLKRYPESSGEASEHLRFINEDLIPFIDKEYRTDPTNRGIWGLSYGGLFAIYVMLNASETFQNYIIASPDISHDGRIILENIRSFLEGDQIITGNIYSAVGEKEGDKTINNWKEFIELIENQKSKDFKLTSELLPKETHLSMIPVAFTHGLRAVYGKKLVALVLEEDIKEKGIEEAIKNIYELKQTNPEGYNFSRIPINVFGYKLLREGKIKESIEVFKLNVDLYPESPNVYHSLGEAYEKNNELEKACENYEIAYNKAVESSATNIDFYKKYLDRVDKMLKK